MVRALRYLADNGGGATSVEIRHGVPGYRDESGHRLTYTHVGQAHGLRRERLTTLLEQITVESELDEYIHGSAEHPALAWIEYWSPEVEPPDGYICHVDRAAVLGAAVAKTFDPRERTGQLGFWAYSGAETDDRLGLIDRALAKLSLTPAQRDRLRSARAKLREWKTLLPPADTCQAGLSYLIGQS